MLDPILKAIVLLISILVPFGVHTHHDCLPILLDEAQDEID